MMVPLHEYDDICTERGVSISITAQDNNIIEAACLDCWSFSLFSDPSLVSPVRGHQWCFYDGNRPCRMTTVLRPRHLKMCLE
jgi:hypothetical protein